MKNYSIHFRSAESNCKSNALQCSQIYTYLIQNGHKIVDIDEHPDYIIINSCGLDEWHENYSYQLITSLQKTSTTTTVIVIGCLTKINPEKIGTFEKLLVINDLHKLDDVFFNTVKYENLNLFMNDEIFNSMKISDTKRNLEKYKIEFRIVPIFFKILRITQKILKKAHFPNHLIEEFLNEEENLNKFYVKISDGCLNNCSYCIIKKAKDRLISRPIMEIIKEIELNIRDESNIYLISDDCGCYGKDIQTNIHKLVAEIHTKFPTKKIDFNYLNPQWIIKEPKKYWKLLTKYNVNYIMLTIQSGSPKILKLMNRNNNINSTLSYLKQLKRSNKNLILNTVFMVGFPDENFWNFGKSIIASYFFDYAYVVKYSDRFGTPSYDMKPKIKEKTKVIRAKILRFFILANLLLKMGLERS